MALNRENFIWHKLHSLTGIIPIGFYMLQHLTLNSFAWAGPDQFNGVIGFFEKVPKHLLLAIEILVLGVPILFHGVYGLFITQRAQNNVYQPKYRYAENFMFLFQRITGVLLFLMIIAHVMTTTVAAKLLGRGIEHVEYGGMQTMLTSNGYLGLILYMIGVALASYHLAYGLWNFCIRWGITIGENAQLKMRWVSLGLFFVITGLGWLALFGFLRHDPNSAAVEHVQAPEATQVSMSR